MLPRAGLAVVALAVVAWLGVLLRDTRLTQDAVQRAFRAGRPSARALARIDRELDRADVLSPTTANDVLRARFLLLGGRTRDGVRVAGGVTAREPENLDAWVLVLTGSRDSDPARAQRALRALRRLDPIDARGR